MEPKEPEEDQSTSVEPEVVEVEDIETLKQALTEEREKERAGERGDW
jgi:hypothetical protein